MYSENACVKLFYEFDIDPDRIDEATQFSWQIDPKSEEFMSINMKARKFITSENFDYTMNDGRVIEGLFFLVCFPKYTNEWRIVDYFYM